MKRNSDLLRGGQNVSCNHCRKQSYPSRRNARRVARTVFPGSRLNAYRCYSGGEGWHLGHPDPAVRESLARRRGEETS